MVFAYYTSVLTSWMTAKEPPAKIRVDRQILQLSSQAHQYFFQSFEDVQEQGRTLYFWKDGYLDSYLIDNFGPGTAAHDLYRRGIGVTSTQEYLKAMKTNKGTDVL